MNTTLPAMLYLPSDILLISIGNSHVLATLCTCFSNNRYRNTKHKCHTLNKDLRDRSRHSIWECTKIVEILWFYESTIHLTTNNGAWMLGFNIIKTRSTVIHCQNAISTLHFKELLQFKSTMALETFKKSDHKCTLALAEISQSSVFINN